MNPKRQFLVALAILVLVALAVFILSSLEDPKKYVPHLVFLRIERTNGVNVAVFRFDAPKNRNVRLLLTPSTAVIVSGTNRIPTDVGPDGCFFPGKVRWGGGELVKAGASQEFHFVASNDDVWRLEMEFFRDGWWWYVGAVSLGTIQSEPITNSLPSTADTPR